MSLYVIVEPLFHQSSWCRDILRGLQKEAARRRLELTTAFAPADIIAKPGESDTLFIVGSYECWIRTTADQSRDRGLTAIVISDQPADAFEGGLSFVSSDIHGSTDCLIRYLRRIGCSTPALYGASPASLADIGKENAFEKLAQAPDIGERVFYNRGSLRSCFDEFYPRVGHFDSVICVNDYAAISLIEKLKENSPNVLAGLSIVSFSDTLISRLYSPSITSLSINFKDFGKAAFAVFDVLNRCPEIASVHTLLKWELHIRETTGGLSLRADGVFPEALQGGTKPQGEDFSFYRDSDIGELIAAENLLCSCDAADIAILIGILRDRTYEQISAEQYLSAESVKYRVRKMIAVCGLSSRSALIGLIRAYIRLQKMEEYLSALGKTE